MQLQSNCWYQFHREDTQFHREVDQCSNTVRHPNIIYVDNYVTSMADYLCKSILNTVRYPTVYTCWFSWNLNGWLLLWICQTQDNTGYPFEWSNTFWHCSTDWFIWFVGNMFQLYCYTLLLIVLLLKLYSFLVFNIFRRISDLNGTEQGFPPLRGMKSIKRLWVAYFYMWYWVTEFY